MAVILKMSKYILCYLILSHAAAELPGKKLNYTELIKLSLLFFEAQRSGKLPTTNKIPWRGDSALNDRGDNGEDLTGGYYDGANYVKHGHTIAYSITMLSWGLIAYEVGYRKSGQYEQTMDAVKWGTDYLIKCHVAPEVFYGQVGSATEDPKYWGRPEDLNMTRPAYKINNDRRGSVIAAETVAALAASSMVFHGTNNTYSQILVKHSKQLFELVMKYEEHFRNDEIGDTLIWAAIWLYRATKDSMYRDYSIVYYDEYRMYVRPKFFYYNEKTAGVQLIMAQVVGSLRYVEDATAFCNYAIYNQTRTPRRLVYIDHHGTLSHAVNIAFICLQVGAFQTHIEEYIDFAKEQLDYIVGAKSGFSYLVGYGDNFPKKPYHMASSCQDRPAPCDWKDWKSRKPNPQILYGALVSGPNQDDEYVDIREAFRFNEVTIDYNSGFQGLLAGLNTLTNTIPNCS